MHGGGTANGRAAVPIINAPPSAAVLRDCESGCCSAAADDANRRNHQAATPQAVLTSS